MDISIIVVNYNVRYFLHLCLQSLEAAIKGLEGEIIVVDNASEDGSVTMIQTHFPQIRLIANTENVGFGRACNQGINLAAGRFVLFVNPDTLIGESLLEEALEVFNEDDKIGAVGVCLLDGKGNVLPESKRAIPSLWSGFTKFSGLSDIFPGIPLFNGYYAPHINYDQCGDIEVLPGAFMLIRKSILDEIGGFDPRFFMYAEDIDLSYRILQAGYRIRYVGSLHMIHFKGESTQKSEKTYTNTFFHSMRLFIQKYQHVLYKPFVAWILVRVIGFIQWVKSLRKQFLPLHLSHKKPRFPEHVTVLSGIKDIENMLRAGFQIPDIEVIPDDGYGRASFYLRYAPAYLQCHPDTAMMLDVRSLSFDQIVALWRIPRQQPFYVLDGLNSYLISSQNKEKQGEVHTFTS